MLYFLKGNCRRFSLAFILIFLSGISTRANAGPILTVFQQGMENSPVIPAATTDLESILLGCFFGLMIVMALYNLLLYFSLKDKVYLLYVATTIFSVLTTVSTNGLGGQYFWPEHPQWDGTLYITFAGISIFFSSRFAAVFLKVKDVSHRYNQFLWLIGGLGLSMALLSLIVGLNPIYGFARWLVLLSLPSYLAIGFITYKRGYKPALFYLVAWLPYILGVVVRTLHGAYLLPDNFFTYRSVEIGGALEIVLLSFALADRIKGLRKEVAEKELEKEQFKTKLLQDQKEVLEKTVEDRTRELREANLTKDKFFSIIAHDLRSPMIGLQGVGQKLEYFIKKNKQEKLLQVGGQIDQSIDQLNHLLNNLLNWASAETGSVPFHPQEVDLKGLVEENISLYESLAKAKEVRLINDNSNTVVLADVNMMATVIRNLLSNAIKFTRPDSAVEVKLTQSKKEVTLSVIDEGEGISEEKRARLFSNDLMSEEGSQAEKGFGLGLKLCKEFTEKNNGTLEVAQHERGGTMFTVKLKGAHE